MNKYNKELHKKSRPAEFAVMDFIKKQHEIFGYPEHRGDVDPHRDILTSKFDMEVEYRLGYWHSYDEEFPFETVTIPLRKKKYVKPWTLYFVVRDDCKKTLMFSGEDLLNNQNNIITKKTTRCDDDMFIEISRDKGVYFNL